MKSLFFAALAFFFVSILALQISFSQTSSGLTSLPDGAVSVYGGNVSAKNVEQGYYLQLYTVTALPNNTELEFQFSRGGGTWEFIVGRSQASLYKVINLPQVVRVSFLPTKFAMQNGKTYQFRVRAFYGTKLTKDYAPYSVTFVSSTSTTVSQINPPNVSVSHSPTSPAANDTITIKATATDDKNLRTIQIFFDNRLVQTCQGLSGTSRSCAKPILSLAAGSTHTYYATATDDNAQTTKSTTGKFTIKSVVSVPTTTQVPSNISTTPTSTTVSSTNISSTSNFTKNETSETKPTNISATTTNATSFPTAACIECVSEPYKGYRTDTGSCERGTPLESVYTDARVTTNNWVFYANERTKDAVAKQYPWFAAAYSCEKPPLGATVATTSSALQTAIGKCKECASQVGKGYSSASNSCENGGPLKSTESNASVDNKTWYFYLTKSLKDTVAKRYAQYRNVLSCEELTSTTSVATAAPAVPSSRELCNQCAEQISKGFVSTTGKCEGGGPFNSEESESSVKSGDWYFYKTKGFRDAIARLLPDFKTTLSCEEIPA